MRVIRHYVGNDLRNFNYLVGSDFTREAIVIDPLDAEAMLGIADENGWSIKLIINTHEHHDHIGGNPIIRQATGAKVCAHEKLVGIIPFVDVALRNGSFIELGDIRLRVLLTPGHTAAHICLLSIPTDMGESACLFSGDTLFNAAAGNCRNGGDVLDLYHTFDEVLSRLDDSTLLYPGHDYLLNNIRFALDCEPGNLHAEAMESRVSKLAGPIMPVITLGEERLYNPFLRLSSQRILQRLRNTYPDMSTNARDIFIALRRSRDNW